MRGGRRGMKVAVGERIVKTQEETSWADVERELMGDGEEGKAMPAMFGILILFEISCFRREALRGAWNALEGDVVQCYYRLCRA